MEQSNKRFDVLIPVARKDTSFVKHVVTYIRVVLKINEFV